ncbi:TIR domain-containing protein [Ruminococcaceae bacterium FB2012]|nr:TIR domain-containing protein [Ruminococcaceae bacterium FB2012]
MASKAQSADSYDFFISFAKEDVDTVRKIVEVMENIYHVKCWFQLKDSKAEFVDAIMDGIEKSRAFLLFVSPHSAKSYFVLNEVHHAMGWNQSHEEYKVVPIILDKEDPELHSRIYKDISFYVGRYNMLKYEGSSAIDSLILTIFDQTGYDTVDEALVTSTYHISENESIRLKAQNEVMLDFSEEYFRELVKPDSLVLDIGCAGGDFIASRLEGLEYRALLGLDIDGALVEKAEKTYGSDKNKFVQCNAMSDQIENVLDDYLDEQDERGFDVITISALILHIADPVHLLRTARRYLTRTGYLMIQDEDDGANVVHPNSRFFDLAFRIWADSKESGDRHCARKIPSYLKEAGFKKIRLCKCGISNVGMTEEHKAALWDLYFNHHLWLAADENMFYDLVHTPKLVEEYRGMYDEYKKKYDAGEIFIQLGFYVFTAQR